MRKFSFVLVVIIFVALALPLVNTRADGDAVTVNMTPQGELGRTATASLRAIGVGLTRVVVNGAEPEAASHPLHIHKGICTDLDPTPAYALNDLKGGVSDTVVNVSLSDLSKSKFAIEMHASADNSAAIACGNIGQPSPDPTAVEPHMPQPTPDLTFSPVPGTESLTFPETNRTVTGLFLDYWNNHGGLPQQGYPISDALGEVSDLNGKAYTVQYFERAVFEYHPENKPPFDVLLSLLGTFQYQKKYPKGASEQQPNNSPDSVLFPSTGKRLGGRFLQYWQSNGGLAQQGYPISNEFTEKSDLNGKTYRVQYFERAVFEYHPENKPPFDVLLSQLGTFQYMQKYEGK